MKRLLQWIVVMLFLTVFVFTVLHLSGDPAVLLLPADATPAQIEQMRHALGLDRPILTQYIDYVGRLVRGDLGTSYRFYVPVSEVIWSYLPNTLVLSALALCLATIIALVLGISAAVKRDTLVDLSATFVATLGQSMPTFWFAILLLLLFGVKLKWLPVSGMGSWRHYVMPVISLGWYSSAVLTRLMRSSVLEVLNADHVRVARSKGLTERTILLKHVLRNASLPVITVWGLQLGALLRGSVVTETVFGWPGIGRLSVESVLGRDYPVVLGLILVSGILFSLLNVLVDLSYVFLDPRVTYQ
ncbi:ABC transporter permease [Candidatus Bipolaricaulota bacterium]|nr:ABC transporter permease [Candidatus Bipolaricaulota bacterium]